MTPRVVDLAATDTHPLRRSVLRDGTASDAVVFDGDELASTFHLGVRADAGEGGDGEPLAISTWVRRRYPDRPGDDAVQLRGMATHPDHRDSGLGARLLAEGIDRCRADGAVLVWARARVPALEFYARHGFVAVGPEYVDLTTGLAHCDVVRELG